MDLWMLPNNLSKGFLAAGHSRKPFCPRLPLALGQSELKCCHVLHTHIQHVLCALLGRDLCELGIHLRRWHCTSKASFFGSPPIRHHSG